ncbi:hypothetical protein [Chryseobacterium indoltheticum]
MLKLNTMKYVMFIDKGVAPTELPVSGSVFYYKAFAPTELP